MRLSFWLLALVRPPCYRREPALRLLQLQQTYSYYIFAKQKGGRFSKHLVPQTKIGLLTLDQKLPKFSCITKRSPVLQLHIYPPIARKPSKRYNELAQELLATYLPHHDGGIPLSAFSNRTTSKLVLHTVPLMLMSSREAANTNFKVIGLS